MSITAKTPDSKQEPGSLIGGELFWRDHQPWLQDCGYMLRPRYRTNWTPSWKAQKGSKLIWYEREDGLPLLIHQIIDAIRISDGAHIALKKVFKSVHPYEAGIGNFFSTEPLASDPRNHCVPILDVLQVPDDEDRIIIVMPLLRPYDSPRFDTFGEALECFRQLFEGIQFMHDHHVAHRDCDTLNFMLDASTMYPSGFHPQVLDYDRAYKKRARHFTRTQRKHKYYLIDFGISRRYDPADGPPLEDPIWGGDKTVPEFQNSNDPCNPFPTDIYYIGNLIREDFLQRKFGFEFMESLIADMVQDDPAKRPDINEVVRRFSDICQSLSGWKMRSRVIGRKDNAIAGCYRSVTHWTRRIGFILRRVKPIPSH